MGCYNIGDILQILAKGTNTILYETTLTSKMCGKMVARFVFFKYGLEKGTYSLRKKRN